jgi:hypothetical protein
VSYAPFTAIGFRLSVYIAKVIGYSQSLGLLNAKKAFEVLEPRAGKLASSVLRGRSGSNATLLPDFQWAEGRHNILYVGLKWSFLLSLF